MKTVYRFIIPAAALSLSAYANATTFEEKQAFTGESPVLVSAGHFPHILGQAVADFDNDGDLDLYVTNGMGHANYLYLNDGSGQFHDVAEAASATLISKAATSVTAADLDGDGWIDLLVGVQAAESGAAHPIFLKHKGLSDDGTPLFEDQTSDVGLDNVPADFRALGFAVADLDGDTDLDVYMAGFNLDYAGDVNLPVGTSTPNILLRNDLRKGELKFTDITDNAGVAGVMVAGRTPETQDTYWHPHTWVVYSSDVNNDRKMDLIALNDAPGKIDVFINKGNMEFEILDNDQVAQAGGWMGVASADFNRDGMQDYFFTNLGSQLAAMDVPSEINLGSIYEPGGTFSNKLVLGKRGNLRDISEQVRIRPSSFLPPVTTMDHKQLNAYEFGWGATAFDANNDGWEDLYWVGASYPGMPFNGIGRFFQNDAGKMFADKTFEAGLFNTPNPTQPDFADHFNGYSVLDADIDADGDLDLIVLNAGDEIASPAGTIRVLENQSMNNESFLSVSVQDRGKNTQGIGAKVSVYPLPVMLSYLAPDSGVKSLRKRTGRQLARLLNKQTPRVQEAVATTGAYSSNAPVMHFGLGDTYSDAYLVKVSWASGGNRFYLTKEKDISLSK